MTCSDFSRLWNDYLDDPSSEREESLSSLESHTIACESCRRLRSGYQLIAAHRWTPPQVSHELTVRILDEWKRPAARVLPLRAWLVPLAAAASIAVAVVLTQPRTLVPDPGGLPPRGERIASPAPRALALALADATSATIDLVREASEPAARVGQQMFLPSGAPESARPSVSGLIPGSSSLGAVGARVDVNVRSLSTSAKRAFGFLGSSVRGPETHVRTKASGA
jgi:hypothetical protein